MPSRDSTHPPTTVTDPLFLQGLESILAPYYARNASPDEIRDVTKRAEAFYLSSTAAAASSSDPPTEAPPSQPLTTVPPVASTDPASSGQPSAPDDPPYPLSFAHLAHLISTGAPIPGIRDIPDELNEQPPTKSERDALKKPWEREQPGETGSLGTHEATSDEQTRDAVEPSTTGEGDIEAMQS
ncbi:hypothetical protein JCM10212_006715 [Sporobolomyces blumeae]